MRPTSIRMYGLPFLALLLTACPETKADPPDAATTDTAIDTSPMDAGPCGMVCSGASAVCDEAAGVCVACTATAGCSGTTALCLVDADPTMNQCVVCLADADCTDAATAKCDTAANACVACDTSAQCTGIAGTEVCETAGTRAGNCVECTGSEAAACGASPCNPLTNVCSAFGTGRRTCEVCDTDANCSAPDLCVPMQYMGADRADAYCLTPVSATCMEPFSLALAGRASLSGAAAADYCGINENLATCEAVRGLLDNAMCPTGMDSECPTPSGLCRTVGVLGNRCTYECAVAAECSPAGSPGDTCGRGAGGMPPDPQYCGG